MEKLINRNWSGIVSTCNLEHWKEALATIVTYTNGQEQMNLCDELGKRLEANGRAENLINACVCYICSANLENLVNCWQKCLGTDETDTSESLQDLVEKIMVLKYCFKNYHPEISAQLDRSQSLHKLNSKLVKYAKLLADQGCFLNAYSYLNDSNDSSILEMKDRIYNVLDPMIIQQFQLRKPESPFKPVHHQSASKKSSYGHSSQSTIGRNPSIFSPPSMTTPSVQPYPYTGQLNNMNPVNHPMPISNIYPTQDLSQRSTTPINKSLFTPANPAIPVMPVGPMPSMQSKPADLSQNTGQSFYTPSAVQTQPQISQNPQLQSYMNTKPATGWNDPPVVAPKVKNTIVNQTEKPAFFQPSAPSSMPLNPSQMFQQQQQAPFSTPISNQNLTTNAPQVYQPPSLTNPQFMPQQTFQPQLVQPKIQPTPQQPEKPIQKAPIPNEHAELQFVFDSLLNKTLSMSSNAATKRKLDDVARKLEILYDKLRDSSVRKLKEKKFI